jgi:hypothetical protein
VHALKDSYPYWLMIAVVVLPVVYLLPTIIGAIRRVENLPLVFLFNVMGGLSGVGWLGAMILALGGAGSPRVRRPGRRNPLIRMHRCSDPHRPASRGALLAALRAVLQSVRVDGWL